MEEQFIIGTEFGDLIGATLRAAGLADELLESRLSDRNESLGRMRSRSTLGIEAARSSHSSKQVKVPAARGALRRAKSDTAIRAAGGGDCRNLAATVQSAPDMIRHVV